MDVILICICWYAAYPLSYRHLEQMMEERGVSVRHSTINRWAIHFLPVIGKLSRKHKSKVGICSRMNETYIKARAGESISTVPLTSKAKPSIYF